MRVFLCTLHTHARASFGCSSLSMWPCVLHSFYDDTLFGRESSVFVRAWLCHMCMLCAAFKNPVICLMSTCHISYPISIICVAIVCVWCAHSLSTHTHTYDARTHSTVATRGWPCVVDPRMYAMFADHMYTRHVSEDGCALCARSSVWSAARRVKCVCVDSCAAVRVSSA